MASCGQSVGKSKEASRFCSAGILPAIGIKKVGKMPAIEEASRFCSAGILPAIGIKKAGKMPAPQMLDRD